MKAKELRIGNWVNTEGNERQVGSEDFTNYREWAWGMYKPVPLTEDWLKWFRFKKPAHSWCGDKFHLCGWGFGSKHEGEGLWCVAMNKNNAIVANIKHVHQLQNLYHALTGEEL